MVMNQEKINKEVLSRLRKLEDVVFGEVKKQVVKGKANPSYKGAKGGILLLIKEGYFQKKRTTDDVVGALEGKGYLYNKKVVGVALYRLSKPSGPLVGIGDGNSKVYANRK